MGQKVNPISFRLGYCRSWDSLWYSNKKSFADRLLEDMKIRKFIKTSLKQCAISQVIIERASEKIRINIHTARPGVIIGRKGADIDRLREDLTRLTGKAEMQINIREVKNPATSAQLVAENIALQLERRIAFRRAMKKSIQQTMDNGAKGIQVKVKGRLGGSEIARTEWYRVGSIPLHTIRADVDYGFTEAMTAYGKIGVKVWIYRGEVIERPNLFNIYGKDSKEESSAAKPKRASKKEAQPISKPDSDKMKVAHEELAKGPIGSHEDLKERELSREIKETKEDIEEVLGESNESKDDETNLDDETEEDKEV